MLRTTRFLSILEKFNADYPEDKNVQINDEFLRVIEEICDGLLNVEIIYTYLTLNSHMCQILKKLSSVMKHFLYADIAEPLDVKNFILFMKLSQFTTRFKLLVVSELNDENFVFQDDDDNFVFQNDDNLFNCEKEECICNTYKSKLKNFKTNSNKSDIHEINEYFTCFLIEYLLLLSELKTKDVLLKKKY